jgi:TfoX/Sxy family transcriptional regulator of competence genes
MLAFLKDLLDEATASLPGVSPRRAFGSWGYYVDNRIFALAYSRDDRLGVKLPDADAYAAARALPGAAEWAPHGAAMSAWVLLPAELHDDRDAVDEWVSRAFQLVRAAPTSALRKPESAKKAAPKKAAPKKAAPKKAAPKKAAPKKAAPKKAAPKKAAPKKAAPKKAAPKKAARSRPPSRALVVVGG